MGIEGFTIVLIDVQKGFSDESYWGKRNNPDFEDNIKDLLKCGRRLGIPVLHIQHLSEDAKSPLRPGQEGAEFIPGVEPQNGERVFQKVVNSAFIGTHLEEYLKSKSVHSLIIAGLTTDHCVSTSVRMAANLGFQVFIAADCTATFNRQGLNTLYPADVVHDLSLASLNGEFATIIKKEDVEKLISVMPGSQHRS